MVVEKSTLYHAFGDWIVAGSAAYNMQQEYDIEGLPVVRVYPSGLRVLSEYDWADRPAGVSFQRLGKNSPVEPVITETLYEPFGPMSVKHYANGWSEGRTYDERYFLDEIQVVNTAGQFITNLKYTQDNVGNITRIDDHTDQSTGSLLGNGESGRVFEYDDLYRLRDTRVINLGFDPDIFDPIGFDLDLVGNRTKVTTTNSLGVPSSTDYVYFPDDGSGKNDSRLKSVSSGRTYAYDQRGQPIDDGNTYYWYDNRARLLAEVAHSGNGALRHMYDYSGKRSAHFGGGGDNPNDNITVALAAFWGNENICEEQYPLTSGPNAVLDRIYFAGSPVAIIYSGGWGDLTRVFLSDHLGTTYANGDENGNILWRAEYKPFGEIAQITKGNSDEDPGFRFPGQELDDWFQTGTTDLTELYYNVHRFFDPVTGRYSQPDPVGLFSTINLFSYADENPVSNYDPTGLACVRRRPLNIPKTSSGPWLGFATFPDTFAYAEGFTYDLSHTQFFYSDGTNIGFFKDNTIRPDKAEWLPHYIDIQCGLNDCILRKAVSDSPMTSQYCLLGALGSVDRYNCHDWALQVLDRYSQLMNTDSARVACGLEKCDKRGIFEKLSDFWNSIPSPSDWMGGR